MNENPENMKQLLRSVVGPTLDVQPSTHLWPKMSIRLQAGSRWNMWDWIVVAVATAAVVAFPGSLSLILLAL